MKEKIAVLVDSGSDINRDFHKDLFHLPLVIQIDNKTYTDGVDIDLETVLSKLDTNKVTTSLPNTELVLKELDKIKSLGYTDVICITISSGLSGTNNILRLIADSYTDLNITVIDTKNISKGSGYSAYLALELIDTNAYTSKEIIEKVLETLSDNKTFFTIGTVDYLRKGGRIGLVSGTVASILNIKPIISCNEKGVYYTVKKTRGYQKAINLLIDVVKKHTEDMHLFDLTVLIARVDSKVKELIGSVKSIFQKVRNFEIREVTPALAIHTGPDAFGLVVRKIK